MPAPAPVELFSDCASCGLEAGVVEVYDVLVPACRFGVPASTRCKLCQEVQQGTFDRPPARPLLEIPANACPACLAPLAASAVDDRRCARCGATADLRVVLSRLELARVEDFVASLDEWAAREGFASREDLVAATFVEHDVAALFAKMQRRQKLEVLIDPFAAFGHRHGGGSPPSSMRVPLASGSTPPKEPAAPPPSAPPRAIVYPLVSVICADGEVHPKERAVVDAFLRAEGMTPLTDDELRVHHPSAAAPFVPIQRREAFVRLMCEAASADGVPDESERRVIRAYASAWDIPDEKVEIWLWSYENMNASLGRQVWLRLRRFVLSARWENTR